MAFLDRLMFWRRKDDLAIPEGPRPDIGLGMDTGLDKGHDLAFGAPDKGPGFPGSFEEPPPDRSPSEQPGYLQQPMPTQSPFQQQPFQQPAQPQQSSNDYIVSKNIEVLSSKLDALRAGIESINQRLAHLERIASGEYEQRRRSW